MPIGLLSPLVELFWPSQPFQWFWPAQRWVLVLARVPSLRPGCKSNGPDPSTCTFESSDCRNTLISHRSRSPSFYRNENRCRRTIRISTGRASCIVRCLDSFGSNASVSTTNRRIRRCSSVDVGDASCRDSSAREYSAAPVERFPLRCSFDRLNAEKPTFEKRTKRNDD